MPLRSRRRCRPRKRGALGTGLFHAERWRRKLCVEYENEDKNEDVSFSSSSSFSSSKKRSLFHAERRGRKLCVEDENEDKNEDEVTIPMAKAISGASCLDGQTSRFRARTSWRLVSG
jgi:hypothetical protein